jgi:hypothetical protein
MRGQVGINFRQIDKIGQVNNEHSQHHPAMETHKTQAVAQ